MKSCSVQVMSTTLSFVDEKHIRNVTVNNACDSEVKLSKSKGDDDNAIDIVLIVSQSNHIMISLCLH